VSLFLFAELSETSFLGGKKNFFFFGRGGGVNYGDTHFPGQNQKYLLGDGIWHCTSVTNINENVYFYVSILLSENQEN
jgi:hypothetical protein